MPKSLIDRTCILVITLLIYIKIYGFVNSETFLLGYITGSKRKPGDREYSRPGLQISGAMTLAIDEVINKEIIFNVKFLIFCIILDKFW